MSFLFTPIISAYLSAIETGAFTISPGLPFIAALREWQDDNTTNPINAIRYRWLNFIL